ncbi:MAG: hypothetical protein ACE5FZ_03060 [Nitrospiria bacterium]
MGMFAYTLKFFCPSVKLIDKPSVASKTIKRYDQPLTPYQKVMESPNISQSVKTNLIEQMRSLYPFDLRKELERKQKKIFVLLSKK